MPEQSPKLPASRKQWTIEFAVMLVIVIVANVAWDHLPFWALLALTIVLAVLSSRSVCWAWRAFLRGDSDWR
jgi:hypothetical protein